MKKDNNVPVKSVVMPLTWFADYLYTKQRGIKIIKNNAVNIKTPYVLLCTHASVLDYCVASVMTFPKKLYNVCDKVDFMDHNFVANTRNCIYEEKFSKNPQVIRNIKNILDENNIVALYPEIRYSFDGTNSSLAPSLYKIIRMLKVPVVVLNIHGSYSCESCWNKKVKKGIIQADMVEIINEKEIKTITIEEIKQRIDDNMKYNEEEWNIKNDFKFSYKGNCKGLNNILYKCPACMEEYKIIAKTDYLYCSSCGKQWKMNAQGEFEASLGETEYKTVVSWCRFERNKLRTEIMSCEYNMFSDIRIERVTKDKKIEVLDEEGELWHNEEGLMIFFKDGNDDVIIEKPSEENYSYSILYNYKNKGDCLKIFHDNQTYLVYPLSERFSITKFALAVELLYDVVRQYKCNNKKGKNIVQKAITVSVEDLINNEEKIEEENKDMVIAVEFKEDKNAFFEKVQDTSCMVESDDDSLTR